MNISVGVQKRIKNLDLVKIASLILSITKPKFKKTKRIKE